MNNLDKVKDGDGIVNWLVSNPFRLLGNETKSHRIKTLARHCPDLAAL